MLVLHKVTMTCEVLATLQKNVVNLEAPRMEIVLQVLEPAVLFSKCIYLKDFILSEIPNSYKRTVKLIM